MASSVTEFMAAVTEEDKLAIVNQKVESRILMASKDANNLDFC